MPPAVEVTPLFAQEYWVHLPILILVISLVYAGTRYDDWQNILREGRRWVVRPLGFLFVVVFILYVIITDPETAAGYVQIGFEGISDAAKAVGDFFTWLADGAH